MHMTSTMNTNDETDAVWRPDVTVATVIADAGRFLLVEETVRGELVLNQPAGHLEPNESLAQAACRETLEETGWQVELTHLIGVYQWQTRHDERHFVRFTFAANPVAHDPLRSLDAGIVRTVWLNRSEMADAVGRLRSPMVLKSVDDWLAGQRVPLSAIQSLLPGAG